jgi:hypothetical protein
MADKPWSFGTVVTAIQTLSDGLQNVHTATGTFQTVKTAKSKVDDAYSKLTVQIEAYISVCVFLNLEQHLDWSEVASKLFKAKSWLSTVTDNWDVTALIELQDSLASMLATNQVDLRANWNAMITKIDTAKTRLNFFGTLESDSLERALRLYDLQTSPGMMIGSIDALQKAEDFISRTGIENENVEKFLTLASSRDGAPLDLLNEPDIKTWLDDENRREKFAVRFRGKGQ